MLRYGRFSRRVRGMMLDWIITLIVIFGAVLVATTVGSDHLSRPLGILVVIALLLYEPVLVSFTGGTLGHYFSNLRVVDERSGGNVSFLLSRGCLDNNYCSTGERMVSIAMPLLLLAASALCIALGWRGKLFGARRTS